MVTNSQPINMAGELKALKHDIKNQKMKRLPANTTIQRRPLSHAPIASPFAGASVQKVVYVSTHTPIMAAVKRVRRLLSEIEKRALQEPNGKASFAHSIANLAETGTRLAKANEEVLVKASGRAMAQALKVGDWFRTKEKEMMCKVEVRTGSVQAVDDIVEGEEAAVDAGEDVQTFIEAEVSNHTTTLEGGETTMELLGETTRPPVESSLQAEQPQQQPSDQKISEPDNVLNDNPIRKKRKRARRKRLAYTQDDLPEARLRWIKTVEVAISFKV